MVVASFVWEVGVLLSSCLKPFCLLGLEGEVLECGSGSRRSLSGALEGLPLV